MAAMAGMSIGTGTVVVDGIAPGALGRGQQPLPQSAGGSPIVFPRAPVLQYPGKYSCRTLSSGTPISLRMASIASTMAAGPET